MPRGRAGSTAPTPPAPGARFQGRNKVGRVRVERGPTRSSRSTRRASSRGAPCRRGCIPTAPSGRSRSSRSPAAAAASCSVRGAEAQPDHGPALLRHDSGAPRPDRGAARRPRALGQGRRRTGVRHAPPEAAVLTLRLRWRRAGRCCRRAPFPRAPTFALTPRRFSAIPAGEFTKRTASTPNRSRNLAQPRCGSAVISITAVPERESCPGRQVVAAQIEIHIELVTGERATLPAVGDERGRAGVHERELHVGMRCSRRRSRDSPGCSRCRRPGRPSDRGGLRRAVRARRVWAGTRSARPARSRSVSGGPRRGRPSTRRS